MNSDPFDKYEEMRPSAVLSEKVLKTSSKKINPNFLNLSLKYGSVFMISILFSLLVCPQKGVGLVRNDFPFFHHILHQSEILCGLFCGLVFFLTTHLLTFFLLNHFERIKIIKTYSYLPLVFMSGFFGLSMTPLFSNNPFGFSYNISWVAIVGVSYFLFNHSYSKNFFKFRMYL